MGGASFLAISHTTGYIKLVSLVRLFTYRQGLLARLRKNVYKSSESLNEVSVKDYPSPKILQSIPEVCRIEANFHNFTNSVRD